MEFFFPEKSNDQSSPTSNNQDVPSSYTYQFTRHMMSCNNINMGKNFGKDFEPSVSLYGIVNTIKLSQDNASEFNSNTVFVSNLLRTWITAFLLYGSNKTELNLYISPYLKEETTTIGEETGTNINYELKRGNYAKNITHTANKFLRFLTTLKNISDKQINGGDNNQNESTNRIDNGAKTIDDFNNLLNKIITKKWYNELPSIINLYLPMNQDYTKAQNIKFTKKNDNYSLETTSLCNKNEFKDTVGPTEGLPGFEENGNLIEFMKWFEEINKDYGKPNEPSLIHVVTHSQVMQKYLKDNFELDIDAFAKDNKTETISIDQKEYTINYSAIRNSNSWRFQTSRTPENIDELKATLKPGIPLDKKYAKAIENAKITGSLCGSSGSVKDACKKSFFTNVFTRKTAVAAGGKQKKRITRKPRKSQKTRKSRKSTR